jgi:hypothetical protein
MRRSKNENEKQNGETTISKKMHDKLSKAKWAKVSSFKC